MKKIALLLLLTLVVACSHKYLPIVKTTRSFPPVSAAKLVQAVPENSVYFGTIKVVPRDYSFPTNRDYEIAVNNLLEAAAKAGARYVFVTHVTAPSSDYYSKFFTALSADWGDGLKIEAELYR